MKTRNNHFFTALAGVFLAALLQAGAQLQLHAQLVADGGTLNLTTATNLAGNLTVGDTGGNTLLNITGPGGAVTNLAGTIGANAASINNRVTVQQSGAGWFNNGNLTVGSQGSGNQLVVSNGAVVANAEGYLGFNLASSNNTALISGPESLWSNSSHLYVGNLGSGNQLVVSDGAVVANDIGYLGFNLASSNNTAWVTGPESLWTNRSFLHIGSQGSGNQLVVSNGAIVASEFGSLSFYVSSSNNMVLITGPGSRWSNTINLFIGNGGGGNRLVVSNGAVVANALGVLGYSSASSNNAAWVTGPDSLWTNSADLYVGYLGSGNQLLVTEGGRVHVVVLRVGVNARATNNLLRLDYGTVLAAGGVIVRQNNTLSGNGTISGVVTINSGATLAPGNSIGRLVLSNAPSLQGALDMEINYNGSAFTNDQLQVLAPLTYGGALEVTSTGIPLEAGLSFQLFSASGYSGAFTSLTLPALDPGLMWTNQLLIDGSIAIVPRVQPSISGLVKSGTNLVFDVSGGTPGGAYTLLTATNVALPLSIWTTNRTGNFDWLGNLTLTNAIGPATPEQFFTVHAP